MTQKLKPCPFCGECSDFTTILHEQDHAQIRCEKCFSCGPIKDQIGDWKRPHTAWNTRAEPAPLPDTMAPPNGYELRHHSSGNWYWLRLSDRNGSQLYWPTKIEASLKAWENYAKQLQRVIDGNSDSIFTPMTEAELEREAESIANYYIDDGAHPLTSVSNRVNARLEIINLAKKYRGQS